MELIDVPTPVPGRHQALVRLAVSRVNFIDIYHRSGAYKVDRPMMLGSEGAGTVEAVGPDVVDVAPGDRVAYAMVRGSYAEYAVVPADKLVKIPPGVDLRDAVFQDLGLANFAASIGTFGRTSVSSKVSTPDSQVTVHRNGSFTPATSR
jgi:NADPH:quinone reductase-like Zn-dependent oxidoreductase